jgi:hypothetical protein
MSKNYKATIGVDFALKRIDNFNNTGISVTMQVCVCTMCVCMA